MTLAAAVQHFFDSPAYKNKAKVKDSEGGVLRNFKSRYDRKLLAETSVITMLKKHGYTVNGIDMQPPLTKKAATKKKKK